MKENKLNRKLKVGEFAKVISGPYEGEIVISIYAANLIVSLTNGKNTWHRDRFIHPIQLINCEIVEVIPEEIVNE